LTAVSTAVTLGTTVHAPSAVRLRNPTEATQSSAPGKTLLSSFPRLSFCSFLLLHYLLSPPIYIATAVLRNNCFHRLNWLICDKETTASCRMQLRYSLF